MVFKKKLFFFERDIFGMVVFKMLNNDVDVFFFCFSVWVVMFSIN